MSEDAGPAGGGARAKVLVKEKIGESGVELLREHFEVEIGTGWSEQELAERIGDYHGILIRSATKMDAGLIERAGSLRVIGRAGVGVADDAEFGSSGHEGVVDLDGGADDEGVGVGEGVGEVLNLIMGEDLPPGFGLEDGEGGGGDFFGEDDFQEGSFATG